MGGAVTVEVAGGGIVEAEQADLGPVPDRFVESLEDPVLLDGEDLLPPPAARTRSE